MRHRPISRTTAEALRIAGLRRVREAFRQLTPEEVAASEAAARAKRLAENPVEAARVAKADAKRKRKAERRQEVERNKAIAAARAKGFVCDHDRTEYEACPHCEHDRLADGETDGARL